MNTKYIISVLLCVIFLLLLYTIILYNLYKTDASVERIYKRMLYSDVKKYFKPGDLLFFSFINADIKTRSWINSRFPHIGMIVRYNDELFVIELVGDDNIRPRDTEIHKNAIITPLFDRISNYAGSVYYASLKSKLSAKNEKILEEYVINRKMYNYATKPQVLCGLFTYSKKLYKKNRYCTEFIAEILDAIDISSKPVNSSKISLTNEIFNLTDGSIYTKPVHILCDKLMIKKISDGDYITYC